MVIVYGASNLCTVQKFVASYLETGDRRRSSFFLECVLFPWADSCSMCGYGSYGLQICMYVG